jgi:tetratricopeptide (TPR) repeat protein
VARDLAAYLASAQERLRQAQLGRAAAEARAQEAGAKAKAERHARRLTLALAVAAAVLLASGAAGWRWYDRVQHAHALRVAATDSKVEAALAEAAESVRRHDWPQASAAATRARELHAMGASAHWEGRIDELLADLGLVTELDDVRLLQTDFDNAKRRFHRERALPRFAEVFGRYGIRAGADPAEVAARLAQRPAPVRGAAVAGLENWWLLASGRDDTARDWLWAVLQAADDDEWRARVRGALAKSDRRALEQLAAQDDAARQPPGTLNALASGLLEFKAYDAVIALLRPAQQRHPGDFWINLQLTVALDKRQPPDHAEALRFHSIARALRPAAIDYAYLGFHLVEQRDWDGAIFVTRKAIELHPGEADAYDYLGLALENKGDGERAQAAYRKALELSPDRASAHNNLGWSFYRHRQMDQAVAAFERAIRLDPSNAKHHYNLGNAQYRRKDLDAALAAYEKAIERAPGFALAHQGRGKVLLKKGRVDDAVAACEQAVRLAPTSHKAHSSLGNAWRLKGRLDRAIAAYSIAVELSPGSAVDHYNLGCALQAAEDWSGATAAYREAVRLAPNVAEAHCNLRQVLEEQGQFAEALAAIEQGHRLGSGNPNWRYPSAKWLKESQRVMELNAKLPGILDGSEKPATVGERLDYASVCKLKSLYGASARLYASAFTAEPALAEPLGAKERYRAACVAARAGSGQGRDVPELGAEERARWRKQALEWLRGDLALWADRLDRLLERRSAVQSALQRWQREKALAGIREPEELAKTPEPERAAYLRFWADVQGLLVRCLAVPPGK